MMKQFLLFTSLYYFTVKYNYRKYLRLQELINVVEIRPFTRTNEKAVLQKVAIADKYTASYKGVYFTLLY